MSRFSIFTILPLLFVIVSCGGDSSKTSGASAEKRSNFGGKTGKVKASEATEPLEDTSEGILLVFDKAVATKQKGPTGPTKESNFIVCRVESVSTDLSHFTIKKAVEGPETPKIGDPVHVVFQWPLDSHIGLAGSVREDTLAIGTVEKVEGAFYTVLVNHEFSEAKIPEGSVALIRWY